MPEFTILISMRLLWVLLPLLFKDLSFSNKTYTQTYLITERDLLDICFSPKVISFFKKDVFNIVIGSLLPASLFFVFLYNFLGFPILVFVIFCLLLNYSKLIDIPKFYPIVFWLKHSHENFETLIENSLSKGFRLCVMLQHLTLKVYYFCTLV